MATNRKSKGQVVVVAKQLIAGTEKLFANKTQVEFAGSAFTPAQITSKLQALVTLRSDVEAAQATARAKVAREVAESAALRAFMSAFVLFVKATFGTSPEALAAFGIIPKARVPLTSEAMAAAAAKRASTRAARHTMGAKQKKGIKGAVTGVLVTPTTSSSPTVPAQSSPTAPAAGPSAAATPRPA